MDYTYILQFDIKNKKETPIKHLCLTNAKARQIRKPGIC